MFPECLETLKYLPFANISNIENEFNTTGTCYINYIACHARQLKASKTLSSLLKHRHALTVHLNTNSLQNKFEELELINDKLKASIVILTKTKLTPHIPIANLN